MIINLLSRDNGVGLTRDAKIVKELLISSGHTVDFSDFTITPKKRYDMNIFIELISPKWFTYARMNCILPNPEWFEVSWRPYLRRFKRVFAKTKCAQSIFAKHRIAASYVSFTSENRFMPNVIKENTFFHLAGSSLQKQTKLILTVWKNNPNLPHLTVVQHPCRKTQEFDSPNITTIYDQIPEEQLMTLQNKNAYHLCPSETEGFGHYIMEALSCGSVVISTDAPPMNELVTPERGVLCEYYKQAPQRLAVNYYTDEEKLLSAVRKAIQLNDVEKQSIKDNGRRFYEENDRYFREAFVKSVNELH